MAEFQNERKKRIKYLQANVALSIAKELCEKLEEIADPDYSAVIIAIAGAATAPHFYESEFTSKIDREIMIECSSKFVSETISNFKKSEYFQLLMSKGRAVTQNLPVYEG